MFSVVFGKVLVVSFEATKKVYGDLSKLIMGDVTPRFVNFVSGIVETLIIYSIMIFVLVSIEPE